MADEWETAETFLYAGLESAKWPGQADGPAGFYPSMAAIDCHYGSEKPPIHRVRVTAGVDNLLGQEISPSHYAMWAWWDTKDKEFQFVFAFRGAVEMCFPYGTKIEEELGRGKLLAVTVEVLEQVDPKTARGNPVGYREARMRLGGLKE